MQTILDILEQRISTVLREVSGQEGCPAIVKPTQDPKFGDYQANGVMGVAKQLKTNPRQLAEQIVAKLDLSDLCETPEIAGPGFINLRLKPEFLAERLARIATDPERLALAVAEEPKTVVVDFSSPNVAKQMHVGHLRSTIIGDAICRLLEFSGHNVIRQNHIGDWGTQFGMLIAILDEMYKQGTPRLGEETTLRIKVHIFEEFYRLAKSKYDDDPTFAQLSREWVVKLQSNDSNAISLWKDVVEASLAECTNV